MLEKESEVVYTIKGKHSVLDENGNPVLNQSSEHPDAMAKIVFGEKGSVFYFVKKDGRGRLYNPHGLYAGNKIERDSLVKSGLKKVDKVAFQHYLAFLRTGSLIQLSHAERAL